MLSATFGGTSTVYITDGVTGILVDGFFSRPSVARLACKNLRPNMQRIDRGIQGLGAHRIDVILVSHSHYDHVMDAPVITSRSGATLYGSESTLNIATGYGVSSGQMRGIGGGDELTVGAFRIRIFEGIHSPGEKFCGTVDESFSPPSRVEEYKTGECLSFHIQHPEGSCLVHASANFVPGQFKGVHADCLFLGTGASGTLPSGFVDAYWANVVEATQPAMIIPVHWDNLTLGLHRGLRRLPRVLDSFHSARQVYERRAREQGIEWRWPRAYETFHYQG